MRRALLAAPAVAAILLALPGCEDSKAAEGQPKPAAAEAQVKGGIGDPVRFVLAAYDLDKTSPDRLSPEPIRYSGKPEFSPRLRSYFALEEQDAGDEVGRVDFNIFTGTQDGTIANVKVVAKDVEQAKAPRQVIVATFTNEGVPSEIRYYFEKIGDRWFLDDISSPGDGKPDGMPPWTLSTVLKYGW